MMTCFDAKLVSFSTGDVICDYGRPSDAGRVGILQSGSAALERISVDGDRSLLEYLAPGDLFGDIFAFSSSPVDSIRVVCAEPSKILFIDYQHITKRCEKACTHHSVLVQNMLGLIADKVQRLNQRLEVLTQRTIRAKLLCYLELLSCQQHTNAVRLPFSLVALADYINADRSAMMRELRRLKEDGVISMKGKTVTLLSFPLS